MVAGGSELLGLWKSSRSKRRGREGRAGSWCLCRWCMCGGLAGLDLTTDDRRLDWSWRGRARGEETMEPRSSSAHASACRRRRCRWALRVASLGGTPRLSSLSSAVRFLAQVLSPASEARGAAGPRGRRLLEMKWSNGRPRRTQGRNWRARPTPLRTKQILPGSSRLATPAGGTRIV